MTDAVIPNGAIVGKRYRIVDRIGGGAVSVVYRAIDAILNRQVALRVYRSEFASQPRLPSRLLEVCAASAPLSHPNLVLPMEVIDDGPLRGFVFPFVQGAPLSATLNLILPAPYALHIARQIGGGLAYLHSARLVHRHVQPSSIMLFKDHASLLDYGVLEAVDPGSGLTASGFMLGNPLYMSPEQAAGLPADRRTDIYALACVLYEMLTGQPPFTGKTPGEILWKHASIPAVRPSDHRADLPRGIDRAIMRALDKQPESRYAEIAAFLSDLDAPPPPDSTPTEPFVSTMHQDRPWVRPGAATSPLVTSSAADGPPSLPPAIPTPAVVPSSGARPDPRSQRTTPAARSPSRTFLATLVERLLRGNRGVTPPLDPSLLPTPPLEQMPGSQVPSAGGGDEPSEATESLSFEAKTGQVLAESTASAILLVQEGPLESRRFELVEIYTKIGRDPALADMVLAEPTVSRLHAQIIKEPDGYYIQDEESRAGTIVNNAPVARQRLQNKDEIQLGRVRMQFIERSIVNDPQLAQRVRATEALWQEIQDAAGRDNTTFVDAVSRLINGPLREALGYSVERAVPIHEGIAGCLIEAPLLWIRYSRFPILFVAFRPNHQDLLPAVIRQFDNSKATEHFALLVAVRADGHTGNEVVELRRLVSDSVYRKTFVVLDRDLLLRIVAANDSQRLVEVILEQGVELSSLSPYVVRGPVPANMFFGREQEIKEISQAMLQGNYAVVGGRRIGKSSILASLTRLLSRDPRYAAYYLNCEDTPNRAGFLRRVELLFQRPVPADDLFALRQLFLDLKAQAGARTPVFLLDEVDALIENDAKTAPEWSLTKLLRSLAHERTASFVFCGSKVLSGYLKDGASPFFNFCLSMVLGPLTPRSVAEIFKKPMRQLGIKLVNDDRLVEMLVAGTSCHPSLVQWVCNELLHNAASREIAPDDMARTLTGRPFRMYYCETAWGDMTPLERAVSVLVDRPTFTYKELKAAARARGLTDTRALQAALTTLKLYPMLREEDGAFTYVMRNFPEVARQTEDVDALFDEWLSPTEV